MISAIILAGGNSTRFGGEIPKQFLEFEGRILIDFTISTFSSIQELNEIIIVVPSQYKQEIQEKYPDNKIVIGGKTRKESSYNGILACNKNTNKVLIHDAARIFVTTELIKKCILSLNDNYAVTLAIPVVDTIALCEDNKIKKMEDRNNLRAIQTPQGFDFNKIKLAHETFKGDTTDDIRLMLDSGFKCKIINGHEDNYKITTQSDFQLAKQKIKGLK